MPGLFKSLAKLRLLPRVIEINSVLSVHKYTQAEKEGFKRAIEVGKVQMFSDDEYVNQDILFSLESGKVVNISTPPICMTQYNRVFSGPSFEWKCSKEDFGYNSFQLKSIPI